MIALPQFNPIQCIQSQYQPRKRELRPNPKKTWCIGPNARVDYNLTLYPLQSRLQQMYHGQPYARVDINHMPELTLSPSKGLRIWPLHVRVRELGCLLEENYLKKPTLVYAFLASVFLGMPIAHLIKPSLRPSFVAGRVAYETGCETPARSTKGDIS